MKTNTKKHINTSVKSAVKNQPNQRYNISAISGKKSAQSALNEKGVLPLVPIILIIIAICLLLLAGCSCLFIAPASVLFIGQESGTETPGGTTPGECLSDKVPPNWAFIITEAGKKLDVPPAMIAAIYLTEHHSTTFGGDIDPNGRETPCSESYAGAKGPFQIMPEEAKQLEARADELGLSKPTDVCRYRDGAYAGAMVIKGKMGYTKATKACPAGKVEKGFKDSLTNDEIKRIACRYCGCCTCKGCGSSKFDYCDFALQRFKDVAAPCP
jgi:hypothetical protein